MVDWSFTSACSFHLIRWVPHHSSKFHDFLISFVATPESLGEKVADECLAVVGGAADELYRFDVKLLVAIGHIELAEAEQGALGDAARHRGVADDIDIVGEDVVPNHLFLLHTIVVGVVDETARRLKVLLALTVE